MDFRSFIIQGVDGEFNFLPEGGLDENQCSTKSVNNEAPVINAEPIFAMHPLDIAKNIMDSQNTSYEEGGLSSIGPDAPSYLEVGKRSKVVGKRKACQGIYHSWSYAAFEEVAELKKPFVLEEMPGYRPSSKEEAAAVEEATVTSIEAFVFKGFVEMPYVGLVSIIRVVLLYDRFPCFEEPVDLICYQLRIYEDY
nr:hypothetical protein [Tanacetum cinerariifolium]